MRKLFFLLTILICAACLPKSNTVEVEETEEFKQLSKILIEIRASSKAGVAPEEWSRLFKKYSIASDNYKINTKPDDYERIFLENISNHMRSASDAWRINFPYNCNYSKPPSNECIKQYSEDLFQKQLTYGTKEEIYDRTKSYLIEKHISINEDKSEYISLYLGLTSSEIEDFFVLHNLKL